MAARRIIYDGMAPSLPSQNINSANYANLYPNGAPIPAQFQQMFDNAAAAAHANGRPDLQQLWRVCRKAGCVTPHNCLVRDAPLYCKYFGCGTDGTGHHRARSCRTYSRRRRAAPRRRRRRVARRRRSRVTRRRRR